VAAERKGLKKMPKKELLSKVLLETKAKLQQLQIIRSRQLNEISKRTSTTKYN